MTNFIIVIGLLTLASAISFVAGFAFAMWGVRNGLHR